jgi:hypothetical protein
MYRVQIRPIMYRVEIRPSDNYEGMEMAIFMNDKLYPFTTLAIVGNPKPTVLYFAEEDRKWIADWADSLNCFYGPSAFLGQYYDWSKLPNDLRGTYNGVIQAEHKPPSFIRYLGRVIVKWFRKGRWEI